MKKIVNIMFAILLSTVKVNPVIEVNNSYFARNYVVMDGNSSEVLEGKDYHSKRSVASISKLMTAIIALESDKLFYSYTITNEATNIEGSSVYLKEGESYRLIDLVYGLLLRSGNDAAYAISLIIEKNTNDFVKRMNEKALTIGMKNSSYSNPCGLDIDDEGNISSAYDMALLMRYCMNNELFKEVISCKKYRFGDHIYENKNKLLKSYKYCLGGKTGYTYKAKRTLVTAAKKDNQYLIMVTLDCGGDYAYHKAIYEEYFNKYIYIVFLKKGKNYIDEYIFDSPQTIGVRILKTNYKKGIKMFFINPITMSLKIKIIFEDGKEIDGGEYFNIKLI